MNDQRIFYQLRQFMCRNSLDEIKQVLHDHPEFDINYTDHFVNLLFLAIQNQKYDIAIFFINHPNINLNYNYLNNVDTILKMAVIHCIERPDIIKLLLDRGADVNYVSHCKYTALFRHIYYLTYNHLDIVKLLLDYGADPSLKSSGEVMSALEHAKALHKNCYNKSERVKFLELIDLLENHNLDIKEPGYE